MVLWPGEVMEKYKATFRLLTTRQLIREHEVAVEGVNLDSSGREKVTVHSSAFEQGSSCCIKEKGQQEIPPEPKNVPGHLMSCLASSSQLSGLCSPCCNPEPLSSVS